MDEKKTVIGQAVLPNRERVDVLSEDGKFYVCEGRMFRKSAVKFVKAEKPKKKKKEPEQEVDPAVETAPEPEAEGDETT